MSVIAKSELTKLIRDGRIVISPFSPNQVGPASVDLHIGNRFWAYRKVREIFHITPRADFRQITREVKVRDYFLLMPGESVMGMTREKITLPDNICGRLEGRSRFARLGLLVHITASFMQPGISNRQTLEMYNASPIPLAIHPGTRICQFVFEYTVGRGHYRGKFRDQ